MAKKDWQIRGSTIYLFVMLGIFIGILIPVGVEWLSPFIGLFYYFKLKKEGRIKKFDMLDIGLILLYTIVAFVGLILTGLLALNSIPWYKIILVGLAADIFGSLLGTVPVIGDFISGLLSLILCMTIVGGLPGIMLGLVLAVISMLPGPSFGANTLFLIIFRIFGSLIFGWSW